jgi:hypothetical protein
MQHRERIFFHNTYIQRNENNFPLEEEAGLPSFLLFVGKLSAFSFISWLAEVNYSELSISGLLLHFFSPLHIPFLVLLPILSRTFR